jgi:hypothetical protein
MEYEGHWHPKVKKGSNFKAAGECNKTSTSTNVKRTHDKNGNPIDRTPPAANAPHEHTKGNKTEHWCGHDSCSRWGNHPTSKHDEWASKRRQRKDRRKGKRNNQATLTTVVGVFRLC